MSYGPNKEKLFQNPYYLFINFFFLGGGARGLGRVPPPPKKGGVISFDCQNLTVFSKTVKTGGGGGQPSTIKILLIWSFFFFSWPLWYFMEKFDADHKEELKIKFHDYHIFILMLIIATVKLLNSNSPFWKDFNKITILNCYSTNNNL